MDAIKKMFKTMQAGVVTVGEWVLMPDGEVHKYLWCENWMVVTDKMVPLEKFKSSEKWSLVGIAYGEIAVWIPGCVVKGFAACEKMPKVRDMYKVAGK